MNTRQRVIFDAQARAALLTGIGVLGDAVQVALGPVGRTVAYDPNIGGRPPEILTDGATIARRIIRIRGRYENMGLLLARHLAWNVRQAVGDGSATAVVLLRALLREATRYTAAGVDPTWLRHGIERGVSVVLDVLRELARPVRGKQALARLALAATGDAELSTIIGEAVDMVGPEGTIEIEGYTAPYLEREYVEGARWKGGYFSSLFADEGNAGVRVELEQPAIVVSDVWAETAADIVPALQATLDAGAPSLLVVAAGIRDEALTTMLLNKSKGTLRCVGVRAPEVGIQRDKMLEHIALLTGARFFRQGAEGSLRGITAQDLGRARRAWAESEYFAIIGGQGNPAAIREEIRVLRSESRRPGLNPEQRCEVADRLGKLMAGACVLKVGAAGDVALQTRKRLAQDAIAAARAALEEGVIPGGGAAYVQAATRLLALDWTEEERYGVLALAQALRAPLATIARNSGYSASTVVAQMANRSPEEGFDARTGRFVSAWEEGILDPLKVARVSLTMATSVATTALTTGALVLTRSAETEPLDERGGTSIEP